ncbi:Spermidine synthase [Microlunatus soli]|uniref:Spermidine synthase n=2 Tax=Microlunatus soli TaxID=630515 RepID=A0A1H1VMN1_9ACTN|nr:Spermidine synthase [Microlunatus soli]
MDELILRRGAGGVFLIPDAGYPESFTLRMGRTDQSYVDLTDPTRLEFDYVQRLAEIIDLIAPAGDRIRVVHVGGALMTLPRYVAHTRPHSAQIVLEPDTELTEFVREHVPLPKRSGIKVRGVAGREGIEALRDDYADAVIVDAFAGSQVPPELTTAEFFADVQRVVDNGVLMINITDKGLQYARRVAAAAQKTFGRLCLSAESSTLKGRRFGNIVLLAADRPLPIDELARRSARSAFPYRVVTGDRLDQLIAGAAPFTDADSESSPAPPDTHFR